MPLRLLPADMEERKSDGRCGSGKCHGKVSRNPAVKAAGLAG
jgi:hypothetical protein